MNRGALQCPARLVFDNWKKCRRNNFKYKDKSDIKQLQKTQLTFFLKKLDEEFYSGLNLSDGERLRLARYMEEIFCDCMNFEKRNFLWFSHSCVRKSYMDSTFKAFFHCRCAIKSLKILSNREFYYPPHIALSGNYYPRFQIIKIFKFIVTSISFEESKLWMVSGTKHKATLRQALPM